MSTLSINQTASIQSQTTVFNVITLLQLWMDRHAQRKQLAKLSHVQLNDIGLTRKAALVESSQPFWK